MTPSPSPPPALTRNLTLILLGLLPALAWDAAGLDARASALFADARGFAHTHDWWLEHVLHNGARRAAWGVLLGLVAMIAWPQGLFRAMPRRDRVGLVLGILLAALSVQVGKRVSLTSCPWDLKAFGGAAQYVSHWRWGVGDGGPGHCFPAGHASTGFSFLAGWFWLRPWAPRAARVWLAVTLLAGLALGGVQVVRGAHYVSHVLWAGWLCWAVGGAFWLAFARRRDGPPIAT